MVVAAFLATHARQATHAMHPTHVRPALRAPASETWRFRTVSGEGVTLRLGTLRGWWAVPGPVRGDRADALRS